MELSLASLPSTLSSPHEFIDVEKCFRREKAKPRNHVVVPVTTIVRPMGDDGSATAVPPGPGGASTFTNVQPTPSGPNHGGKPNPGSSYSQSTGAVPTATAKRLS